jgi:hypothetical protein
VELSSFIVACCGALVLVAVFLWDRHKDKIPSNGLVVPDLSSPPKYVSDRFASAVEGFQHRAVRYHMYLQLTRSGVSPKDIRTCLGTDGFNFQPVFDANELFGDLGPNYHWIEQLAREHLLKMGGVENRGMALQSLTVKVMKNAEVLAAQRIQAERGGQ